MSKRQIYNWRQEYPFSDKAKQIFLDEDEWYSFAAGNWSEAQCSEFVKATYEERKAMFDAGFDYTMMVNGRTDEVHEKLVESLFVAWNERLGFKIFGF